MSEEQVIEKIDVLSASFPFIIDEFVTGLKTEINSYLNEARATLLLSQIDKDVAPGTSRSYQRLWATDRLIRPIRSHAASRSLRSMVEAWKATPKELRHGKPHWCELV